MSEENKTNLAEKIKSVLTENRKFWSAKNESGHQYETGALEKLQAATQEVFEQIQEKGFDNVDERLQKVAENIKDLTDKQYNDVHTLGDAYQPIFEYTKTAENPFKNFKIK